MGALFVPLAFFFVGLIPALIGFYIVYRVRMSSQDQTPRVSFELLGYLLMVICWWTLDGISPGSKNVGNLLECILLGCSWTIMAIFRTFFSRRNAFWGGEFCRSYRSVYVAAIAVTIVVWLLVPCYPPPGTIT